MTKKRSLCSNVAVLAFITCATFATTSSATADETLIRPGHNLYEDAPTDAVVAIGERISPLTFRESGGKAAHLAELLKSGPVTFVFVSTTCPVAKRYVERMKRLYQRYKAKGVHFFAVFPNTDETQESIRDYQERASLPFPTVRDVDAYLAQRLGATMTPQAFLIDTHSSLVYRGAIDDHRYESRVQETYLANALDACLAGRTIDLATTRALGCSIHLSTADAEGPVVYSTHVARILQDNCQSCHRPGQVAPFSLTNYAEAHRWRKEIKAYTAKRLMPPWKAVPGFGHFQNDVSLSAAEISRIGRWVDAGSPQGDPKDLPPAPLYPEGWAAGEPDHIFEMLQEYVIAPEGEDDYRHFVIPYELESHQFIESVDVQPGNRRAVHHVIAYVDKSGKAREIDAADPGRGTHVLAVWASNPPQSPVVGHPATSRSKRSRARAAGSRRKVTWSCKCTTIGPVSRNATGPESESTFPSTRAPSRRALG
jgi:peroxiredoxin